ncbi:MAG: PEGA domain-containing protein [Planctomyces sp.]|nr:PEGA domain-containing protein [Planctomyces sp.]
MRPRFLPLIVVAAGLAACASGCVSRRMTIVSDPPGALVEVDGQRLGLTPVSQDFTYYGTREVTLSMPGYQTLTVQQPTRPPWYQVFPLDFFSDNFAMTHLTDRHVFRYRMQRLGQEADDSFSLTERGRNFRSQAQTSQ